MRKSGTGIGVGIKVGLGKGDIPKFCKLLLGPSGCTIKVLGWGLGVIEFIGAELGKELGVILSLGLGAGLFNNKFLFSRLGEIETKGLGTKEIKTLGLGRIETSSLLTE